MLKGIVDFQDRLSKGLAVVCGWALLALSCYIGVDVVGRKLFSFSLQGSDEIGGYVLAIICAYGFSYTLSQGAHIRLNALLSKFPTKIQAVANLVAYGGLLLLSFMMVWRGGSVFWETLQIGAVAPTPLETPLWVPQSIWSFGLLWFFLHVASYFSYAFILLLNGKADELNTRFGTEIQ